MVYFLSLLLSMSIAYRNTHSYTVDVRGFTKPHFHSEFVSKADELEVYSALYNLGLISAEFVPQFVKDARPIPAKRPEVTRLTYFELHYFDFTNRIIVLITVKINYE